MPGVEVTTLTDCHFAVLKLKDYKRVVRKIEEKNLERKVDFFKSIHCFKSVSLKFVKRIMPLFKMEKFQKH